MTQPLYAMTDQQLGAMLGHLGDELEWPRTPDLAPAVGNTIRDHLATPSLAAPRLSLPSRRRALLLIVAALLAIAGVAIAARVVIELGAIAVRVTPGRPPALPTDVVTTPGPGREVTFSQARAIVGFAPALPGALGRPDRIWVDGAEIVSEPGVANRVLTAWGPSIGLPEIPETRAGAILMQFEGDAEVAAKQLYAETNVFGVTRVDGRDAFWTSGKHELVLVVGDESKRFLVTGNVLIWQDAGFTFRLETKLPQAQAIEIAETVAPAIDPG